MNPPPVSLGLILCDYVHVEQGSPRKVSLIGCFSALRVAGFPASPPFYAYAGITDGIGTATLTLRIESLQTDDELYVHNFQARFETKTQTLRAYFPVRDCVIPTAGWYQATVLVDGEAVAQERFRVFSTDEES